MRNYGILKKKYCNDGFTKTAKAQRKEDIENFEKLLETKRESIRELEAEKAALEEKGKTLHPDDEVRLKRLYTIVAGLEDSIARTTQCLQRLNFTR